MSFPMCLSTVGWQVRLSAVLQMYEHVAAHWSLRRGRRGVVKIQLLDLVDFSAARSNASMASQRLSSLSSAPPIAQLSGEDAVPPNKGLVRCTTVCPRCGDQRRKAFASDKVSTNLHWSARPRLPCYAVRVTFPHDRRNASRCAEVPRWLPPAPAPESGRCRPRSIHIGPATLSTAARPNLHTSDGWPKSPHIGWVTQISTHQMGRPNLHTGVRPPWPAIPTAHSLGGFKWNDTDIPSLPWITNEGESILNVPQRECKQCIKAQQHRSTMCQ